MSEEKRPSRMMLKTSLSETAHDHRRSLLAVSAIGIAIAITGLIPSKITALGIEFSETNRSSLISFLVAVVVYFLFAFIVYAIPDFMAWRLDFSENLIKSSLAEFEEGDKKIKKGKKLTTKVTAEDFIKEKLLEEEALRE